MLPRRARVDLGAMAMKGYSTFPKAPQHCWNLTIRLFSVISRTLVRGGLTPLQRCSQCILQPQLTGELWYKVPILINVSFHKVIFIQNMKPTLLGTPSWFFSVPLNSLYLHTFIIFTNPSAQAGYDTRSIFKWSLTYLNSEFSFS